MYDCPPMPHNETYESPMWKVVMAVFEAIEKGLKKDGFVSITGLGRFYVGTRHGGKRLIHEGYGDKHISYIGYIKKKPWVYFKPSKSLIKFINEGVTESEPQAS